jgi:hypothetical protein
MRRPPWEQLQNIRGTFRGAFGTVLSHEVHLCAVCSFSPFCLLR